MPRFRRKKPNLRYFKWYLSHSTFVCSRPGNPLKDAELWLIGLLLWVNVSDPLLPQLTVKCTLNSMTSVRTETRDQASI